MTAVNTGQSDAEWGRSCFTILGRKKGHFCSQILMVGAHQRVLISGWTLSWLKRKWDLFWLQQWPLVYTVIELFQISSGSKLALASSTSWRCCWWSWPWSWCGAEPPGGLKAPSWFLSPSFRSATTTAASSFWSVWCPDQHPSHRHFNHPQAADIIGYLPPCIRRLGLLGLLDCR